MCKGVTKHEEGQEGGGHTAFNFRRMSFAAIRVKEVEEKRNTASGLQNKQQTRDEHPNQALGQVTGCLEGVLLPECSPFANFQGSGRILKANVSMDQLSTGSLRPFLGHPENQEAMKATHVSLCSLDGGCFRLSQRFPTPSLPRGFSPRSSPVRCSFDAKSRARALQDSAVRLQRCSLPEIRRSSGGKQVSFC